MPNFSRAYLIGKSTGSTVGVSDYFTAEDAVFPQGSAAFSQGVNNHPLIVCPEALDAFVDFPGVVYTSGVVAVYVFWAATVNVGDVNWEVSWERDNPQPLGVNLTVDSFAASNNQADLAPAVINEMRETVIPFTLAEMDGVISGNPYRIRVRRQGGVAPDTLVGDALLFRVSIVVL